jgi:hypothetical protein
MVDALFHAQAPALRVKHLVQNAMGDGLAVDQDAIAIE